MYAVGESASSLAVTTTGRLRALTMPWVTVPGRPSGEPMASTGSPTWHVVGVAERQRLQRAGRL